MAGHHDPRLLFSVPNIRAFHVRHGNEESLTPSGAQTLSLLMVPTNSPFADLSDADPQSAAPEEDFYLHLHLPPELDLPLPATTQIYHQPPNSYLIPRWDLGPDSGAFTRIEFPTIGRSKGKVRQEDVDTFETILAQCTSFLERAAPPTSSVYPDEKKGKGLGPYNPQDYGPGEGYASGGLGSERDSVAHGHIVLIDEEDGSIVGELSEGFNVVEHSDLKPGSKQPVQIELPKDSSSNQVDVSIAPPAYLREDMHPAYKKSTLVSSAAMASRLIVTTSGHISGLLQTGVETFTNKTKASPTPVTFTPTTHERVRKLHGLTLGAVGLSSKAVGQVGKYAQNFGATLARRGDRPGGSARAVDADGQPQESYKPGLLNKSMMAFSTVADGIDYAGRSLLASGSAAATTVVGHRYGEDAGKVAGKLASGVTNVALVYIDAMGVSRKAVLKSVAKGMVVGRFTDGGDLVVGAGDGGIVPVSASSVDSVDAERKSSLTEGTHPPGAAKAGGAAAVETVGFGNAGPPPPAYSSGPGEPHAGAPAEGYYAGEKR